VGFRGGRFYFPVPGLLGGGAGPNGKLTINGKPAVGGGDVSVPHDGTIICQIPGGGGLGDPALRDVALIRRDLEFGYITAEHARAHYGYDSSRDIVAVTK
jgi:N-methylhydantoinase B/oxoprolinase/acetone carboxylase alpha subunit